jgi:AcrR family transcriptional regulator
MNAEDREELILRAATAYFAEQGLGAGTIELARRIGITQPLLYKYFPTKDALIERVYDRLIPKNWNPNWELVLIDQSTPVRQRLKTFYVDYVENVLTYEHVRLFLFSGLNRSEYNARYYAVLSKRIFEVIARAMRQEFGIVKKSRSVAKQELEIVQSLHAVIYHLAYRRFVHGESIDNLPELVERKVDFYLDGACDHFRKLADPPEAKKARPR